MIDHHNRHNSATGGRRKLRRRRFRYRLAGDRRRAGRRRNGLEGVVASPAAAHTDADHPDRMRSAGAVRPSERLCAAGRTGPNSQERVRAGRQRDKPPQGRLCGAAQDHQEQRPAGVVSAGCRALLVLQRSSGQPQRNGNPRQLVVFGVASSVPVFPRAYPRRTDRRSDFCAAVLGLGFLHRRPEGHDGAQPFSRRGLWLPHQRPHCRGGEPAVRYDASSRSERQDRHRLCRPHRHEGNPWIEVFHRFRR